MNNIISKFKSDSRQRNYSKKEMNSSNAGGNHNNNNKITKDNPEKEPFFTISHEFVEQETTNPSVRYSNK